MPTPSLRCHHYPWTEFTLNKTAFYKSAHRESFNTQKLPIQGFSHCVERISLNSLERFMPNFIEKGNQYIPFVDGD